MTKNYLSKHIFLILVLLVSSFLCLNAQDFMMQGWYWDYPKPANATGNPNTESTWAKTLNTQASELGDAGFTMLWLPPFSRASFGSNSNGYDPKDLYDLGEFGLGATGFGFKQDVDNLITSLSSNGIEAIADVVYNHRDGGAPEANPAVKQYITTEYTAAKEPFPSDRFHCILPIGGSTGNGAGEYYIRVKSKSEDSRFYDKGYKIYVTTATAMLNAYNGTQLEDEDNNGNGNGGGGCGAGFNVLPLNTDFLADIDGLGCKADEVQVTLSAADFDAAGDDLIIYLTNTNDGYTDHYIEGLYHTGTANAQRVGDVIYRTYTDFTSMPSGQGGMNYENFRPNSSNVTSEFLNGDWNQLYFFYDYDQFQSSTQSALQDWSRWLWNDVGIRGFRMDAVKHFTPDFISGLANNLNSNNMNPNMFVGEIFDTNANTLLSWINASKANLSVGAGANIDVRAFDFSLRQSLKDASDVFGFDVRNVFESGIVKAGGSGFESVTFVNNHDYRSGDEPVQNNPILAYAYILTNNQVGLPCVFYPDYFGADAGTAYPNVNLKSEIDLLIEAHKTYIHGSQNIHYLNEIGTALSSNYISAGDGAAATTSLIYQLDKTGTAEGKSVIVAINYAGTTLKVDHEINTDFTNPLTGNSEFFVQASTFTDVLGRSNFPTMVVNGSNQVYIELPPFSYSVWVEGTVPVLPTEIIRFSAKQEGKNVQLNWVTGQEDNLENIVLESSLDGRTFSSIYEVEGKGSDSQYKYLDKEAQLNQTNYYRLKMLDNDGSFKYSGIRSVHLSDVPNGFIIQPNPAKDNAVLVFHSLKNATANYQIFDAHGRMLIDEKIDVISGKNEININLSSFSKGTYFVQFLSSKEKLWGEKLLIGF